MKADKIIDEKELAFIYEMIEKIELPEDITVDLHVLVQSPEKGQVDFESLKKDDEVMSIMIDMIALSKSDGEIHNNELAYIKQVGKTLGFSEDDIVSIING